MTFREAFASHCTGTKLGSDQVARLEQHYQLLVKWNRSLNLTRLSSLDEAVVFHYCESLFLADLLPKGCLDIVDVGSGAGFPGIPVAITRPDCSVSLVEAHQRKAVFLREATRGMRNISVVAGRAEGVPRSFDWLIGRAVRSMDLLSLRLADNAAILTSVDEVRALPDPAQTILIPGSRNRVVAMFHVKHVERVNIH